MSGNWWADLLEGDPAEPVDALPPAACARCGRACPCGAPPANYGVLQQRPAHLDPDNPTAVRDLLLSLEEPEQGTGAQRRTRRTKPLRDTAEPVNSRTYAPGTEPIRRTRSTRSRYHPPE